MEFGSDRPGCVQTATVRECRLAGLLEKRIRPQLIRFVQTMPMKRAGQGDQRGASKADLVWHAGNLRRAHDVRLQNAKGVVLDLRGRNVGPELKPDERRGDRSALRRDDAPKPFPAGANGLTPFPSRERSCRAWVDRRRAGLPIPPTRSHKATNESVSGRQRFFSA